MAGNREDLVKWALGKAEEYLLSARQNLNEGRLFVAAEETFRAMENTLEAILYQQGVKRIAYPGKEKEFTGRLALQFLIRDELIPKGLVSENDYAKYLRYASDLHKGGYQYGVFDEKQVDEALAYAEDLFYRAKSITQKK